MAVSIQIDKLAFTNTNGELFHKFNACQSYPLCYGVIIIIQWNPSKADTIGTKDFIHCSEVSLAQGLVIDHAPLTVVASYDKALPWMTKVTVLMRDLPTDSF